MFIGESKTGNEKNKRKILLINLLKPTKSRNNNVCSWNVSETQKEVSRNKNINDKKWKERQMCSQTKTKPKTIQIPQNMEIIKHERETTRVDEPSSKRKKTGKSKSFQPVFIIINEDGEFSEVYIGPLFPTHEDAFQELLKKAKEMEYCEGKVDNFEDLSHEVKRICRDLGNAFFIGIVEH
jgi:hypothetical protein